MKEYKNFCKNIAKLITKYIAIQNITLTRLEFINEAISVSILTDYTLLMSGLYLIIFYIDCSPLPSLANGLLLIKDFKNYKIIEDNFIIINNDVVIRLDDNDLSSDFVEIEASKFGGLPNKNKNIVLKRNRIIYLKVNNVYNRKAIYHYSSKYNILTINKRIGFNLNND